MAGEVADITDRMSEFKQQAITAIADARYEKIMTDVRYDLAMGKLTREEWNGMSVEERCNYKRRSQ